MVKLINAPTTTELETTNQAIWCVTTFITINKKLLNGVLIRLMCY